MYERQLQLWLSGRLLHAITISESGQRAVREREYVGEFSSSSCFVGDLGEKNDGAFAMINACVKSMIS